MHDARLGAGHGVLFENAMGMRLVEQLADFAGDFDRLGRLFVSQELAELYAQRVDLGLSECIARRTLDGLAKVFAGTGFVWHKKI